MVDIAVIKNISRLKNEPAWMRRWRQKSWQIYQTKTAPTWGADLAGLDLAKINYYQAPETRISCVPKALRKILAGYEVQHDSEAVYGSIIKKIADQGVLFTDTDTALKKCPTLFKKYFGKLVPAGDNKFAALNAACWSGGSFVYVPRGVSVALPLQAYFKINTKRLGQFERTLIIADEGSNVTYLEGCSAEVTSEAALHAGVVEIFVGKSARVKYITVQNWSNAVYNLVTKRAKVEENGSMQWLDVNLGSRTTMKYPSCLLAGKGAAGEMISLAIANKGQTQDTGAKMFHLAPDTTSQIISKSVSLGGGKNVFRGMVEVSQPGCKSKTKCESLILDPKSSAQSYPAFKATSADAQISHEATISRLEDDQLFYLCSRGLSREAAESLIVNGFAEPILKLLPMEYAIELNRLIQLELGGHG
jgi:Fe-S cluster assembly protein SufB